METVPSAGDANINGIPDGDGSTDLSNSESNPVHAGSGDDSIGLVAHKVTEKDTLNISENEIPQLEIIETTEADDQNDDTVKPYSKGEDKVDHSANDFVNGSSDSSKPSSVTDTSNENAERAEKPQTHTEEKVVPEWMDVLGNGLLRKKVLKDGNGQDTRPRPGSLVTIKSKATIQLAPNLVEDESRLTVDVNDSISFLLGEGDVIQAWDICIALMELNEKAIIEADERYCYGKTGRSPDIPPETSLIYEIELLAVEPPRELAEMSISERLEAGNKKRLRGNYLYDRREFTASINSYSRALKLLDELLLTDDRLSSTDKDSLIDMRCKCLNNMAAAQLKAENVKALFRKGKALAGLDNVPDAIKTLKAALKLDPDAKVIQAELKKLFDKQKINVSKEQELYQRMMQDFSKSSKSQPWYKSRVWLYGAAAVVAAVAAVSAMFSHQRTAA